MKHKHPQAYLDGTERGDAVQEQHAVAAADLPFEFMMNALRLTEGFPLRLFAERTGLTLDSIRPLLDELAPRVRARLGRSDLPLACILEGGTWAAGRETAARLRGGEPPFIIESDGTVF